MTALDCIQRDPATYFPAQLELKKSGSIHRVDSNTMFSPSINEHDEELKPLAI